MAITDIYVDPSINANSGAGTIGDPYGDLQYALDQTTSQGADGDRFNIKAGTAEVLAASLSITSGYGGTPSATQPLVFQGYTSSQGDGGIGEISGNATYEILATNTYDYLCFIDLKMGNTGSNSVIRPDLNCTLLRCEIHTSSAQYMMSCDTYCAVVDCHFHTWTYGSTNGAMLLLSAWSAMYGCFFDAGTQNCANGVVYLNGQRICVINNIIHCNHVSTSAIFMANAYLSIFANNSLFNEAAGTEQGIHIQGGSTRNNLYISNIIEGWSGTGGYPIEQTHASGEAPLLVSGNVFYNNATNDTQWSNDPPCVDENDTVPGSSPFTDAANDDFTVTADAKEKAFLQVFRGAASSTNKQDSGACQRVEPAGGGGGPYGHFG